MKRLPVLLFMGLPVLFLLIYHRTFQTEYAYLDEAQQLWRNQDGSNYSMFLVQGRPLTGRVLEQLFGSVNNIADLRFIRIFSLAGWVLTAFAWLLLMRKWINGFAFDKIILFPALVFFIASPAVAISIGWASCAELFLATLFGLLGGAMVFSAVGPARQSKQPDTVRIVIAMIFGICSLFLYQNSFGIFLLPFILSLFSEGELTEKQRTVTNGVLIYLAIYLLYFLLFKYQLKEAGIVRADRAAIATNLPDKFLFFFSGPLPKGFSFNLLYNTRSVFQQVFAPLMMILFIVSLFFRYKKNGLAKNAGLVIKLMALLALVYLPSLAVKENFSSYRTMFAFSLIVTLLVLVQLFYFIPGMLAKNITAAVVSAAMLVTGYLNYNKQLTEPLGDEYHNLRQAFSKTYKRQVQTVYFIRPDKHIFPVKYGIYAVKDEFGNPSTLRDWVPEPLTKLLVRELSHSQRLAGSVKVIQFPDRKSFEAAGLKTDSSSLVIDMDSIINLNPSSR